jgi:hypothetical protein
MAKLNITIWFISSDDKSKWQEMWEDYLKFYKQSLSTDVTDATWRRFFDKTTSMYCSIAEDSRGQRLGFAVHVTHP